MRGYALLVSGGDEHRFTATLLDLQWYLASNDIQVSACNLLREHATITTTIKRNVRLANEAGVPLLLVYYGHANGIGWHADGATLWYPRLAIALMRLQVPCLIINNCCHSLCIMGALEKFCDPDTVGLICPWEGPYRAYSRRHENLIRDIIDAWQHSHYLDDMLIHTNTLDADDTPVAKREDPPHERRLVHRRWGALLDHLFFPACART